MDDAGDDNDDAVCVVDCEWETEEQEVDDDDEEEDDDAVIVF